MIPPPSSIVIATLNPGKLVEAVSILKGLPLKLLSLADFSDVVTVQELGSTFAENAIRKAEEYARQTGHWSIADDSGLEVDALGGAPGVISARFAGERVNDADRVSFLLSRIEAIPEAERTARFRCTIAVADSKGDLIHLTNGDCEGTVAFQPRGDHGFGYDSVFIPTGHKLTFGEMGLELKNQLSHRALALSKLRHYLGELFQQR